MPIRPSVARSYKYLILLQRSPPPVIEYTYYFKNIPLVFCIYTCFLCLNKFRNFVYEVTDAMQKFFVPLDLRTM
jgi:hypothetical protein